MEEARKGYGMASSLHLNITALWYTWLWIGFLVDIVFFFFWIWWWCIIGYDVPVRTGILSLLGHGRQATQFSAIYFGALSLSSLVYPHCPAYINWHSNYTASLNKQLYL